MRKATEDDVKYLAPRLRQCDKDEIKANVGLPEEVALKLSAEASDFPLVVVDHKPVAIFGVVPKKDVAYIWMMATPELEKIGFPFLKECKRVVTMFNEKHPLLSNYVDARNELHIKWLKWCGFTFINKHEKYGVEQRPFYEFVRLCA